MSRKLLSWRFKIQSSILPDELVGSGNKRMENQFFSNDSDLLFLSGGVKIDIKQFELELSVADSHLGSSDNRKQTVVKFGAGFFF